MIQNEKKVAKLLRLISWQNRYCLFAKGNPRSRTCKLLTGSLDLSCCKKRQKKSQPRHWLEQQGYMKVLNDTKLILNDLGGHSCSFRTNLVLFRSFRRSLFLYQFLGWDFFLPLLTARRLQDLVSSYTTKNHPSAWVSLGPLFSTKFLQTTSELQKIELTM